MTGIILFTFYIRVWSTFAEFVHTQGLFPIKMYWDHFVDGLLLVNMFIISTKMHIDEGLFCKHVYYQYKNLPYRIILIPLEDGVVSRLLMFEGWHCLMSVDVCLVDLQSLHLSVPLQSTRHRYSEKTSACHSNPLPSLLIWWKTRVFSYHYCLM